MGQCFTAVSIDNREAICLSGSAKLMEHSFVGNETIERVTYLLHPGGAWHQTHLVWAGGSMENGRYFDQIENLDSYLARVEVDWKSWNQDSSKPFNPNESNLSDLAVHFKKPDLPSLEEIKEVALTHPYFYNHTKKEYFCIQSIQQDKWGLCIHPLPILTNSERGCGEFLPQNEPLVGHWEGDIISAETKEPKNKSWKCLFPNFFESWHYPRVGESSLEFKLDCLEFSDDMYYRDSVLSDFMKIIEDYAPYLQDIPLIQARLTPEQVEIYYQEKEPEVIQLVEQIQSLYQQFEEKIKQDWTLLYHLDSMCRVDTYPAKEPRFKAHKFLYLNEEGHVKSLDYNIKKLNQLVSDVKKALIPAVEEEKRVYGVVSHELVDVSDSYYFRCPVCGGYEGYKHSAINEDLIIMCTSCIAKPRKFTIFTPTGRRSKEVTVGNDGDFISLKQFHDHLKRIDRYAQQSRDLSDSTLTFKEKLQRRGWRFDESGVIRPSFSRYQYQVKE